MVQDEASVSSGMLIFMVLNHGEVGLTLRAEFRGLSIDPEHYEQLEPLTPPAPKVTSEGVISIDITEKFIGATKSKCILPPPNRNRPTVRD